MASSVLLLLLGVVVPAMLLHVLAAASTTSTAQPGDGGCKTRCGDVDIPYPFGIGAGCAIDESFEINCTRSAAADGGVDRPFISEWEVLSISLSHGQSRALVPIVTYCYNYTSGEMGPYIWYFYLLPPYRFSDARNKFVVIGCNTIAYIYDGDGAARTRYATGCATVCGSPEAVAPSNGSSTCAGAGCCENTVPRGLTRYNVYLIYDVDYLNVSGSWQFSLCSYAALVETETFVFSSEYVTTARFNETYEGRWPVVLDWAIGNATCEAAGTSACRGRNTVCVDSPSGQGYLCNCSSGYQGNPYLSAGCTDVNECEGSPSPCPQSATCRNTVGGYYCSCLLAESLKGRQTLVPTKL